MLKIFPVPAFEDNYIWVISGPGKTCAVVDPGDESPVIDYLEASGLQPEAILITHKHGDHVGGISGLKRRWPKARVYGPAREPISLLDETLSEGDEIVLPGLHIGFSILDVPGHTEGHIAYYGNGVLFCGDTLFAAGCGRVFSGTFEQLSASLLKLGGLPAETRVYCAHEYTLANIGFAKWVEPENQALLAREKEDRALREWGRPTVPSLLGSELATNPFMRTDQPEVIAQAEKRAGKRCRSQAEVFRVIRTWKDKEYD